MPPRGWLVRETVLRLWARTVEEGGFATGHIAAAFRADRRIGSHERREIAETLYGMLRQYRRIGFSLGHSVQRLKGNDLHLAFLIAWRVLEGICSPGDARAEMPQIDWGRVHAVDERIGSIQDPVQRFALARSLPDCIAERLLDQYGDEADPLARSLNQRAPLTVRANTLKTSREELAVRLSGEGVETTPTRWSPAGLRFVSHANAFSLPSFREGLFEVQDESSQLAAMLVAPRPGGTVVDACAGAGGKTLALGALMNNKGRLWALDVDGVKLQELARRARRAGLSNFQAIRVPEDGYPDTVEKLVGRMSRVLADVPCSGIGALRRNPEARWTLTSLGLSRLPEVQLAIARRALGLVAPGGRFIYATCTVLRSENEDVVDRLLQSRPGLQLVRAAEIWGKDFAAPLTDPSGTFLKLLPHIHDTDGFFAAVLRTPSSPG